jgi:hypothetical protein
MHSHTAKHFIGTWSSHHKLVSTSSVGHSDPID